MKRFGLIGLVALSALALGACDDGGSGDGGGGERNDGTGAGANGDDESCTVEDNGDGTATITCPDGTEVDVSTTPADEIEQCTVEDNGDGTATITCPDGSSVTTAVGGIGEETVRFVQLNNEDLNLYEVEGNRARSLILDNRDLSVTSFVLSADGSRVVYRAYDPETGLYNVYFVDLEGDPTKSVRVNGELQVSGNVSSFSISANGDWVGYIADEDSDEVSEVYVVDIADGSPGSSVKVNGTLQSTGDVVSFGFSPDSNLLAYLVDGTNEGVNELYLVDLADPGPGARVHSALVAGRSVETDYSFSANSETLFYRADQLAADVVELFASDVSDGTPGTPDEVSAIATGAVSRYFVSPNGESVVYQWNTDSALYLVDSGSFGTAAILYPDATTPSVNLAGAGFSGNSSQFLFIGSYIADETSANRLVSVGIDGDTPEDPVNLGHDDDAADVQSFQFGPSRDRLVFTGDHDDDGYYDLFFVDLANPASNPPRVNDEQPSYYSVGAATWAADADVLVYGHAVYGYYGSSAYYGSAVVDLSGDEPGEPIVFTDGTQWESHNYPSLSPNGSFFYAGIYDSNPSRLFNVSSGTSVYVSTYTYAPVTFVSSPE